MNDLKIEWEGKLKILSDLKKDIDIITESSVVIPHEVRMINATIEGKIMALKDSLRFLK